MSHKNYKSLQEAIIKKAKEKMKTKVLPYIQEEMKDSIEEVVYKAYPYPVQYDRRRDKGGLQDSKTMKGYARNKNGGNGFTFRVRNEAKAYNNPQHYLTPLIVMGGRWAYENNYPVIHSLGRVLGYYIPEYYEPRDFVTDTKSRLTNNRSEIINILQKSMK